MPWVGPRRRAPRHRRSGMDRRIPRSRTLLERITSNCISGPWLPRRRSTSVVAPAAHAPRWLGNTSQDHRLDVSSTKYVTASTCLLSFTHSVNNSSVRGRPCRPPLHPYADYGWYGPSAISNARDGFESELHNAVSDVLECMENANNKVMYREGWIHLI